VKVKMTKSETRNPNEARNPSDQFGIRYWSWIRNSGLGIRAYGVLRPIAIIGCMLLLGCADTKTQSTSERQDAAMRDPFGYSPSIPEKSSSSGIGEFDKQGFKHDMDRVLNP
jgi:hypothetical protein